MKNILLAFFLFSAFDVNAQQTDSIVQNVPGTNQSFTLIKIPAGSFTMGSPADAAIKDADETPAKTVQIAEFYMGKYEVEYTLYDAFSTDASISQNNEADAVTRPTSSYIDLTAGMGKTTGFPANSMQFYNAIMFCKWLYQKTGVFYRPPSEAEWEYACRAGSNTIYPFGNDSAQLKEYAWFSDNSADKYHPAGLLKPNAWGLYDMLGNVQEWVLDHYDADFYTRLYDTTGTPVNYPRSKHPHSLRGGSYQDHAIDVRSANRMVSNPRWNRRDPQIPKSKWWNADAPFVGMRLVKPVTQPTAAEAEAFYNRFLVK